MILDTDIIIWYMRGNLKARKLMDKLAVFRLSVISYMELIQGMRNKVELIELRKAIKEWKVEILYINEEISGKALFIIERYYLSHSIELADALIASTAITYGIPLCTGNDKHYNMISDLQINKFKP